MARTLTRWEIWEREPNYPVLCLSDLGIVIMESPLSMVKLVQIEKKTHSYCRFYFEFEREHRLDTEQDTEINVPTSSTE